ncbi:hypothetical protein WICPIJ_005610 [Wickerhamomyces pijperi]|uniref:Uncharacterized protein n=1 Tax=Wickerhamomyces pijperi TaxID=599730 RepID=A0A9P8TM59_WICPI|nr:hypothetical protein WICPIJ_005610 [Wickerhamomyces pijperi]
MDPAFNNDVASDQKSESEWKYLALAVCMMVDGIWKESRAVSISESVSLLMLRFKKSVTKSLALNGELVSKLKSRWERNLGRTVGQEIEDVPLDSNVFSLGKFQDGRCNTRGIVLEGVQFQKLKVNQIIFLNNAMFTFDELNKQDIECLVQITVR